MARSLNRAQIIGNLTRDPELRTTSTGQTVAVFGVATNFVWTNSSGQRQEKAEFHNIVAWRRLAEICGQFLHKGSKVYVEGRLQTRDWQGEDGVKRFRTEIVADNVILLDRRTEGTFDREPAGLQTEKFAAKKTEAEPFSKETPISGETPIEEEAGMVSGEEPAIDDLPF